MMLKEGNEGATIEYVREVGLNETIHVSSERPDLDKFLSIGDQMGNIRLNLTIPIKLSDREETIDHLIVRGPTTKELKAYRAAGDKNTAAEAKFFGSCVLDVKHTDLDNLMARDWDRLCRLVLNFTL